jgi:nucleoid DNA-binding protein
MKMKKIIYYIDERGWGYATALEREEIIKAILAKKTWLNAELAENILDAYLDALRGESTVFQDELLKAHKDIADFLDQFVEEVDEETAKKYFDIPEDC